MSFCLTTSTQQSQAFHTSPRENICRHCRTRSGSNRGQALAGDLRKQDSGLRIVHEDVRHYSRKRDCRVSRIEAGNLDGDCSLSRDVCWHEEQGSSVRNSQPDAIGIDCLPNGESQICFSSQFDGLYVREKISYVSFRDVAE